MRSSGKRKTDEAGKTYTVDHEVHDGLGHEVSDGLVDDADVRVHEIADGLHLPLQLRVHGHSVAGVHCIFFLWLQTRTGTDRWNKRWNSPC